MSDGMYGDNAWLYDRIYAWRDYEEICRSIHELLDEHGVGDGARVLEAACGTGNYLVHLNEWYDVTGYDISADMLAIAREKLPEVELFQADMTEFVLDQGDERFDAVLCLFSSIGFVNGVDQLQRTLQNFADSLRPGGVVVIEPWLTPQAYDEGRPSVTTHRSEDLVISRQAIARRQDRKSLMQFHWLVARRDEEVEYIVGDEHVTTLFTDDEYRSAFDAAGFDVAHRGPDPQEGRGIYVGKLR